MAVAGRLAPEAAWAHIQRAAHRSREEARQTEAEEGSLAVPGRKS